jgi:hypothetical protein
VDYGLVRAVLDGSTDDGRVRVFPVGFDDLTTPIGSDPAMILGHSDNIPTRLGHRVGAHLQHRGTRHVEPDELRIPSGDVVR